jgi:nitrous oxide reductase accessory protein NosL
MNNFTLLPLIALFLVTAGCSRAKEPAAPTPPPNLRADAERLQGAINKAAEQRRQQAPSPTAAP